MGFLGVHEACWEQTSSCKFPIVAFLVGLIWHQMAIPSLRGFGSLGKVSDWLSSPVRGSCITWFSQMLWEITRCHFGTQKVLQRRLLSGCQRGPYCLCDRRSLVLSPAMGCVMFWPCVFGDQLSLETACLSSACLKKNQSSQNVVCTVDSYLHFEFSTYPNRFSLHPLHRKALIKESNDPVSISSNSLHVSGPE
jgi:hypothetical protein